VQVCTHDTLTVGTKQALALHSQHPRTRSLTSKDEQRGSTHCHSPACTCAPLVNRLGTGVAVFSPALASPARRQRPRASATEGWAVRGSFRLRGRLASAAPRSAGARPGLAFFCLSAFFFRISAHHGGRRLAPRRGRFAQTAAPHCHWVF
jgi:hypothetical protein